MTENPENIGVEIELRDPAELRLHPLLKALPEPVRDSDEWTAFVDAMDAGGPEAVEPLVITREGLVMSGGRRLRAAKQLQWDSIPARVRPEWEAPLIIVESLRHTRSLTKGAKVFLSLPMLAQYQAAAETRRVECLKQGRKILQNAQFPPFPFSRGERHGWEAAEQLGQLFRASHATVERAVQIRKAFESEALKDHKFVFQDGAEMTLREYFEPKILDVEDPMGLGEVIKGIGWFTQNGEPVEHTPPARNSHLFYFERATRTWAKCWGRWTELEAEEREQAVAAVGKWVREIPEEGLGVLGERISEERKRRNKAKG